MQGRRNDSVCGTEFHWNNGFMFFNPIRPGLLSHSPDPGRGRGNSGVRMPKIKVNIRWLKWNFAWVIIVTNAWCKIWIWQLFYLLRYDVTKFLSRVIEIGYLPPENGFNFKKWVLMSRIVLLDPKLTPMSISAIFKQTKIFHFQNFWDVSMRKEQ